MFWVFLELIETTSLKCIKEHYPQLEKKKINTKPIQERTNDIQYLNENISEARYVTEYL